MKHNTNFTEHRLLQMIHDYSEKCMNCIISSKDEFQVETSVNLCNRFGQTIVKILNHVDYPYIGSHWNVHRGWCSRIYQLLNASMNELDAAITLKKQELEDAPQTNRLGFN